MKSDYKSTTDGYILGNIETVKPKVFKLQNDFEFLMKDVKSKSTKTYCNGSIAFCMNEMIQKINADLREKEALLKMGTEKGVKLDNGKLRLGLVFGGFANGLKEVGAIGTFGANKYTDNGWQSVPNGVERYKDALMRHLFAWLSGEEYDQESGYRHLAHAGWNCLALLTLTHQPKFLKSIIDTKEENENA